MNFTWLEVDDSSQTTVEVNGQTLVGIVQKVSLLNPPYTLAIGWTELGVFTGIERYETREAAKATVESTLTDIVTRIRPPQGKAGVA